MLMSLSNSLHFAGYEVARSGLMAMVTSDRGGFESASTLSLAAGSVSPFCIFLLWVCCLVPCVLLMLLLVAVGLGLTIHNLLPLY